MQTHGFLRIYDSKVQSSAALTAVLDQAACLSWFAAAVLLSPTRIPYVLEGLYMAGVAKIPIAVLHSLQLGIVALTASLTAAYLVNALVAWRAGRPPSPIKLLLLATTVPFWWYTNVAVPNLLVGIVIWELFHDVQYLAIVWLFNQKRAASDPEVGAFTRMLFGRGRAMVVLYVGLVLAYGSLHLVSKSLPPDFPAKILAGVLAASALLHFYYDGFIWKMRERSTRASLGIEGGREIAARQGGIPGWLVHGAKWSLFFVAPVLLLAASWRTGGGMDPDAMSFAIAEASPAVPEVQFNLAVALANRGDLEAAVAADRRALSLHPMDPEVQLQASMDLARTLVELAQQKIADGSSRSTAVAQNRDDWQVALESVRRARDSFPGNPDVARFSEVVEAAALEARAAPLAP
jgi:tetratricopeptide (TPR) repeat protein